MLPGSRLILFLTLLMPASLRAQEAASPTDPVRLAEADTALATSIPAARAWLEILDNAEYEESWKAAAPAFQEAVTAVRWAEQASQARSSLQPFGERTLVSVQFATFVPDLGPGRYSVLQYLADVAGGRHAIETVSLARQTDGSWRVVGYFVRPL